MPASWLPGAGAWHARAVFHEAMLDPDWPYGWLELSYVSLTRPTECHKGFSAILYIYNSSHKTTKGNSYGLVASTLVVFSAKFLFAKYYGIHAVITKVFPLRLDFMFVLYKIFNQILLLSL